MYCSTLRINKVSFWIESSLFSAPPNIQTQMNNVMSSLVTTSRYLWRGYHIFYTKKVWMFDKKICFWYHICLCTVDVLSCLGIIAVVSMRFIMVLTKSKNSIIQSNFHFDVPTKHQYLIDITILIPTYRIFDTIIHIDYWYSCLHLYTGPIGGTSLCA